MITGRYHRDILRTVREIARRRPPTGRETPPPLTRRYFSGFVNVRTAQGWVTTQLNLRQWKPFVVVNEATGAATWSDGPWPVPNPRFELWYRTAFLPPGDLTIP